MFKISNMFIVPKTMDELDEILEIRYGKRSPERSSAELVKRLTLNFVAHVLATESRSCESKEPILCKDCGNKTIT